MSKDSSLAECRCNQRPVETKKLYTCDSTMNHDSYSPVHLCSATHIRVAICCISVCRDFTLVSPCNIRAQPALEKVSLSEKIKGLGAIFGTWCFLMERWLFESGLTSVPFLNTSQRLQPPSTTKLTADCCPSAGDFFLLCMALKQHPQPPTEEDVVIFGHLRSRNSRKALHQ